ALNLKTGNLTVNAYASISAAQIPGSGVGTASNDIVTTGTISLNTDATNGVSIGSGPLNAYPYGPTYQPLLIASGPSAVNATGKNSSGVWLMGNGASLTLGTVSITGTLTTDIYNGTGI